jgi:protease I
MAQKRKTSMSQLVGVRIVGLVDDIYEDLELWYPKLRLIAAGAEFLVAGPRAGAKYLGKHGYPCVADVSIESCQASDFDAILLPGGFMPDKLRREDKVKSLIRQFSDSKKCIAAICHGGWMAISAGVYADVRVTGSPGIKDDLENAGAIWVDAPVVVDRHFVSSRKPDDLPQFVEAMIDVIQKQRTGNQERQG